MQGNVLLGFAILLVFFEFIPRVNASDTNTIAITTAALNVKNTTATTTATSTATGSTNSTVPASTSTSTSTSTSPSPTPTFTFTLAAAAATTLDVSATNGSTASTITTSKLVNVSTTYVPIAITPSATVTSTSVSIALTPSASTPRPTSAPTTASGNEIWDKVIMDYLNGPFITFIVLVAAVGLCLILLIALICTCYHYRKLKKKTNFPKDLIINNDSAWINSNDDLLMWERNLRATELNHSATPNRPANEKRP